MTLRGKYREQHKRRGLRTGEIHIPHWCSDCTPCGCETHQFATIPCTSIAQSVAPPRLVIKRGGRVVDVSRRKRALVNRCLACGARWISTEYRIPREEIQVVA